MCPGKQIHSSVGDKATNSFEVQTHKFCSYMHTKRKETAAIKQEMRVILQCDFLDLRDANIMLK